MNRLPDDLLLYLQTHRLGQKQEMLMRELAVEYEQRPVSVVEYAQRYVNRALRISKALDGSLKKKPEDRNPRTR